MIVRWFLSKVDEIHLVIDSEQITRRVPTLVRPQKVEAKRFDLKIHDYINVEKNFYKYPIKEWSTVYSPDYSIALVRTVFEYDNVISNNDIIKELITSTDWYQILKVYNQFRYKWKDQPFYPSV